MNKATIKKVNIKDLFDYALLVVAFVSIVVFGVKAGQSFIKMWPVLNSLFIVLLSARVNRMTFLFGAINCVIYSVGYIQEGLYGSLASAILVSCPIQVVSFVRWSKNKYKQATIVKNVPIKHKAWYLPSMFVVYFVAVIVVSQLDRASMVWLDNAHFVLGLYSSLLVMLGFIDGVVVNLFSSVIGLIMWILIFRNNPTGITYLISSIYSLIRCVQAVVNWIKLYQEQQTEVDAPLISDGRDENLAMENEGALRIGENDLG